MQYSSFSGPAVVRSVHVMEERTVQGRNVGKKFALNIVTLQYVFFSYI